MTANYVDNVREVEPVSVYEETETDYADFCHDWTRTCLDDYDADRIDWDQIHSSSKIRQAFRFWKFAYGYANYGRRVDPENLVVFKIPGWFASDELGEWNDWWFGNLEVAKQDDDGEWTAMCLSDIEQLSDRNEESYFRNPIEEEWLPFSLIEFAFSVVPERSEGHLIVERGLDSSEINAERGIKDDAEIVLEHIDRRSRYGPKAIIDSPFEAKDDIKALDWEQYHPDWNGDYWTVDADAIWEFAKEMTMQGWTVCISEAVERETSSDALEEGEVAYIPSEVKDA